MNENYTCPHVKQTIIWYDECRISYSNENYFGLLHELPRFYFRSHGIATNPAKFSPALGNLLYGIAGEIVSKADSTNFATGDAMLNDFQRVYGLVQCTSDIRSNSCYQCLLAVIAEIPYYEGQGARLITPTCNWRYESYPFFKSKINPSPPSSTKTTAPNNPNRAANRKNSSKLVIISIAVPSAITVLSATALWFFWFWTKKTKLRKFDYVNDEIRSTEPLRFNFSTISAATDIFSETNKLGQGGLGSVYKGTLPDRREIAVKRLSKSSGQGDQEFKNEVTLVDSIKCTYLDWERRYKIIGGVARGLVYLHEESRLKIIHRDLKASNILLDKDLNPRIADFGMARLFVLDQTQASTNRIVGTHGYMAPEYILHGKFSAKSDVFSFGVLVLEILSGQRNSSFHGPEIARNLLSYAWKLWINGSAAELLDPTLEDTCSRSEATKCIHVALLCVQENVADRPTMPMVVQMLNGSLISHESPSPPGFFAGSTTRHIEPRSNLNLGYIKEQGNANGPISVTCNVNEASTTELYPR
ncbi:cysteine-rich receptor-like protein kinase 10 isoform X2 [Papaver somniferum]|uniref:cysteine-rich receptor-like protein kinase 10 isoform X2 n=1 Tax=Papaver somniferum TaxID=3469 RepID=UPI000E6FE079|nr:cysteine-rich receptor-like protein kinase 10 isoform X2 [Papaver somniferum]